LRATYSGVLGHSKLLSKFDGDKEAVLDLTIRLSK
jgi:hypothetical protein